jgi:hypothetical protein
MHPDGDEHDTAIEKKYVATAEVGGGCRAHARPFHRSANR